ncbi:single-stranded DNA-binding protein [Lacibacter sp.]|uniref:single-stranded DNA-binding protein n=1 Tax=Lacibacter sp. TaxID=1915409 RepID=UPI002B4B8A91|nr:single-stranded DNA-binding protein [Lacibacter sp.]HLP38950.1 single-stranded DNA-binding protein [Lacibacter sp.]
MEIIGRMTADATVNETKAGKKVVNFSIAINDTYKAKGTDEVKRFVTYINCSYWINPGVAAYLTKGTLVECYGRIGADAYAGKDGEAKARLNFHVNVLKLHGSSSRTETSAADAAVKETTDDLPF